jgi:HlyD family secretion protein
MPTESLTVRSDARELGQHSPPSGGITDAQLLQRFLDKRDEAAFELLMWRHGPMVFAVCQHVLRHRQDAEDACQATFLTLARRAAAIVQRESLSSWLCTVAYRQALRLRKRSAHPMPQQERLEDVADEQPGVDPAERTAWRDLRQRLDVELSRIPEKYRSAFILCHLEGKTCAEAAQFLGCPPGTVQSRIGRARKHLRARLLPSGIAPETCNAVPPRRL